MGGEGDVADEAGVAMDAQELLAEQRLSQREDADDVARWAE
jgi:hypothetical protein